MIVEYSEINKFADDNGLTVLAACFAIGMNDAMLSNVKRTCLGYLQLSYENGWMKGRSLLQSFNNYVAELRLVSGGSAGERGEGARDETPPAPQALHLDY